MKLRINTEIFPIIDAGLYGTILGSYFDEDVAEEYREDFKKAIVDYGIAKINEIFEEYSFIAKLKASNGKLSSPQWYNYHNDSIDFDIEIPDDYVERVKGNKNLLKNKLFFEYVQKNFGSHDGFISFYPTTPERFEKEINGDHPELAWCEYLMWIIGDLPESYQRDFEYDVIEEGDRNGWYYCEED